MGYKPESQADNLGDTPTGMTLSGMILSGMILSDKRHINIPSILSTLLVVGGIVACLVTTQPSFAEPKRLIYGEAARLDSFDPFTGHEAAAQRLSDLIFDGLVEVKIGGGYAPVLAKSWAIEDGGTQVIFTLNDQPTWHDGKPLTPEDVVATVRLLIAKDSEIPNQERFQVIKSAEKIGGKQVRLRFHRALMDPLKACTFKILPAHKLGSSPSLKRSSQFSKKPIGTGPYAFIKNSAQGEVLLEANNKYFRGAPQIKQLVMMSFSDQSIMAQSLMFNSLDLITYVSPRDIGEILGDKNLTAVPYDALSFSFFAMNTERTLLKDRRVRQAISYAVNRTEMLQAFFQGKGQLISGPFPPTSWAYNLEVKPRKFDIERSKSLLKEAGLEDRNGDKLVETKAGTTPKLVFAVPLAGESEMIKRLALAFQGYLAEVGVQVDLQFMDWLIWKKKVLGEHDYDITIASWSFDDSSNITSLFHSSSAKPWGNNFVKYRNSEVDALLNEVGSTSDFDKKRAIYHRLHAILADESPYVYLWTLKHHAAHRKLISGVRVEPFNFFKHIAEWDIGDRDGRRR